MTQVYGQQDTTTTVDDFNTLAFVHELLTQKMQTATVVKVLSCTNDGGLTPVGRVTVQPVVNQMTGNRLSVAHGPIYNALYSRISGGESAFILDPNEGDFGLMVFCSRDISNVVANEGQAAPPGSFRMFDWADGVYVAGIPLGITPTQYVQMLSGGGGINIVSPTAIELEAPQVTLQAPVVAINASTSVTITSPAINLVGAVNQTGGDAVTLSGPIAGTNTAPAAFAGDVTADGVSLTLHKHPAGTLVAGSTAVTGDTAAP